MTIIRARAHSKVNLHLGVGDARPDGYHELVTVFQSLSLQDELEFEVLADQQPKGSGIVESLSVTGLGADSVPMTPDNLVWKAVDSVVAEYERRGGRADVRVAVRLRKGIPTAGGMAGGSADAAAALLATNHLLNADLSEGEILGLAAQLGSDVPFTLLGGTKLGTGRGEQLVPMLSRGQFHWALAFNSAGLSTPKVFQTLDQMRVAKPELPRAGDIAELSAALITGDAAQVAPLLANDLQAPALSLLPELRRTLHAGHEAGALRGIVSGSGPTCAFLCNSAQAAADVAEALIDAGLATSAAVASGPAPGAEIF